MNSRSRILPNPLGRRTLADLDKTDDFQGNTVEILFLESIEVGKDAEISRSSKALSTRKRKYMTNNLEYYL